MDMPADHFTNLMNVNWMGVVLTLKPSLEIMTKQRSGHVIVVNSIGGYMGVFCMLNHTCSRAYLCVHKLLGAPGYFQVS